MTALTEPATGTGTTEPNTAPAGTVVEPDKDADTEKWKALARKHEAESKKATKELETLRTAAMTDQEKAVKEAEERGRTAGQAAASTRLAAAEFKAVAAGRLDKAVLEEFLDGRDMARFLDDKGEPDVKAIEAAVTRLGGQTKTTSFDGGARGQAATGTDMSSLIRGRVRR